MVGDVVCCPWPLANCVKNYSTSMKRSAIIDGGVEVLPSVRGGTGRPTVSLPASRGPAAHASRSRKHVRVERIFSDPSVKPFDQIEWEKRNAEINDDSGKVIFKQENVEVPKTWSLLATKVVVSKYFYGEQNTPER